MLLFWVMGVIPPEAKAPGAKRLFPGVALTLTLAGIGGLVSACGTERPPLDDSNAQASGAPKAGASAGFDFDSGAPRCEIGGGGNVCGCVDLDVLTDVPTLYFVLDRSGSMLDDDKWSTVRTVVAKVVARLGARANFGAMVFPGMTGTCSAGTEVMPVLRGDVAAGDVGPTARSFLEGTGVPPTGGTPTAATMRSLRARLSGRPGRTYVVLATDGGPNCNLSTSCDAQHCIPNLEGTSDQCTPTGPSCCTSSTGGAESCLDADPTVYATADLANAGVPTYVIGVPGSAPFADVLNRIANAGGTGRPGETAYYRVDAAGSAALESALVAVAAKVAATCAFPLGDVPDPGKVNVFLDGALVAKDPDNGWALEGKVVTLVGSTCERVLSGDALNVRVVAGCPTVTPR